MLTTTETLQPAKAACSQDPYKYIFIGIDLDIIDV